MTENKRFISVGTRLASWTTVVIGLVSMAIFFGLSSFQWNTMARGRAESGREVMALFRELVAAPLLFADAQGTEDSVKFVAKNQDLLFARVTVVDDKGGQKVAHQFVRPEGGHEESLGVKAGTQLFDDRVVIDDEVRDGDGKLIGRATLSFSLVDELAAYTLLRRQILLGAFAISIILIGVLVFLTRRRVVRPLARLTFATERLEHGEVVRLDTDSGDEVGQLAGAFDRMAHALREREQVIARRNRDMKLVLDNVGQGFVVIDPRAVVAGERSAIAERWFGAPAVGQSLASWLNPADARFGELFAMCWDQLSEGFMPREVCVEQLPHRLARDGKTWSIDYQVLTDEADTITQVMVVLTDVTAVLEREAAERSQRELVEVFQRLGRDRSGFLEFVADGRRLLGALERGALDPAETFRAVHTLKGNSAVQGIHSVATACHGVETRLSEDGGTLRPEELVAIRVSWERFEAHVARLSGSNRDVVEVEGPLLRDLEARIARRQPHAQLQEAMARWSLEPVSRRLDRLAAQATALGLRLGKGEVEVEVQTDDIRLPAEGLAGFWSVLVHVVRNAVDHGLEPADVRGDKQAKLVLSAHDRGGALAVTIMDNGKGIAWPLIAQKAAERGLPHQTHEQLVEALFADGVSTRDAVTETSGRGVGMAAVKHEVERLGGSVEVSSKVGQGARFQFILPLPGATQRAA